jgi:hypothetical protein
MGTLDQPRGEKARYEQGTWDSTKRSICRRLVGMVHGVDLLKLSSDVELPLSVEPEFVQRVQLVGCSTFT